MISKKEAGPKGKARQVHLVYHSQLSKHHYSEEGINLASITAHRTLRQMLQVVHSDHAMSEDTKFLSLHKIFANSN